jgi:hypothetical protein
MHEVEQAVGLIIDWQNWAVDLAESSVAQDDDRAQISAHKVRRK